MTTTTSDTGADEDGERRIANDESAKYYVVTYDVVSDHIRLKVAHVLEGFGERVQDSVFECLLNGYQYHDLRRRLDRLVNPDEDSIRYYNLGSAAHADVEVCGKGNVTTIPTTYVL